MCTMVLMPRVRLICQKKETQVEKLYIFYSSQEICLFFELYVSVLCVCICACVSVCEYQLGVHVENNFMP